MSCVLGPTSLVAPERPAGLPLFETELLESVTSKDSVSAEGDSSYSVTDDKRIEGFFLEERNFFFGRTLDFREPLGLDFLVGCPGTTLEFSFILTSDFNKGSMIKVDYFCPSVLDSDRSCSTILSFLRLPIISFLLN